MYRIALRRIFAPDAGLAVLLSELRIPNPPNPTMQTLEGCSGLQCAHMVSVFAKLDHCRVFHLPQALDLQAHLPSSS